MARCQWIVASVMSAALLAPAFAQPPAVRVTIDEGDNLEAAEFYLPTDPTLHVEYRLVSNFNFELSVERKRLVCGAGIIKPIIRMDGQTLAAPKADKSQPLPAGKDGKGRSGQETSFAMNNVTITQILEVVPSKIAVHDRKAAPGQKRKRDTLLTKYVIENKDSQPHNVGVRVRVDTLVVNNDGALFASPMTHPGKILNGVELKGKELPEWLQVLERPDLQNPGFTAHFTLKVGRLEGPSRFLCTTHSAADSGWDIQVAAANGDSDCVLYFEPAQIPPGGKRECGFAYGGGIASSPEDEGRVSIGFGGSFEPGKEFTVTAYVDQATAGQSLTLELPRGMQRSEGRATQPVPVAAEGVQSVVLWKGRVESLGTFTLRVRSSNGMIYTRNITVGREN